MIAVLLLISDSLIIQLIFLHAGGPYPGCPVGRQNCCNESIFSDQIMISIGKTGLCGKKPGFT
jgi:hypothetical protein